MLTGGAAEFGLITHIDKVNVGAQDGNATLNFGS